MQKVHKEAGRYRSLLSRAGLRGAVTVGGTLLGAAVVTAAFSMPAGATVDPPANNVIIGSGSSTTYSMMQQLDDLFNSSPGCQQFVPFPSATLLQPLDYSCTTPPTTTANPENPYNDVATEEPALGSSNGIQQLEDQGAHGTASPSGGTDIGNVAQNQNYARSSRALKTSDLKGLNFAAYAEDGVTWFHYLTTGNKVATPSNAIDNLTQPQVIGIWNGTYTNWDQVGGTNAPIVVFSAQEGSGTQSTWKGYLGYDPSAATNQVNCTNITVTPPTGCVGPAVIFENEDAQITASAFTGSQATFVKKTNPDWGGTSATLTDIRNDAIFFFSSGKYNLSCSTNKGTHCGGSLLPTGTTNAIGELAGVAPTEQTILDGQFPDTRYLYNVYSDGSNSNIPAATAATVNYVSEIGFLCNPNKGSATAVLDPNTGATYISEIQADIEAQGFYPLSAGAASGTVNQTPIDEGTLTNPASALLNDAGGQGAGQTSADPGYAQYKPYDAFAVTGPNNDPSGFCLATSTDSNAGS
jgi:ABC-type phosphate transport system substrate-binding protein